jgi:hypothetical protein
VIAAWLRVFGRGLPPRRFVIWFFALAVATTVWEYAALAALNAMVGPWHDPVDAARFSRPVSYHAFLALGLAGMAAWRAYSANPIMRRRYGEWLKTTLWTAAASLPLGPVSLIWQDLAIIGLCATLWNPPRPATPWVLVFAFALPYSALIGSANAQVQQLGAVYGAVAIALGMLLTDLERPWQAGLVACALAVWSDRTFRRALRQLPWTHAPQPNGETFDASNLGWLQVGARRFDNTALLTGLHVLMIGLLAGWVAGVIARLFSLAPPLSDPAELARRAAYLVALASCFAAMVRVGLYCMEKRAPLTFWARLRLGRWIIPEFDRVLVAPLAAAIVGGAGIHALRLLKAPTPLAIGVTVASVAWILCGARPTLAEWSLTGGYRISPERRRPKWIRTT